MSWDVVLLIVVLLNTLFTINLWRVAARRPEKLKEKFFEKLLHGKPIMPQHQTPPLPPFKKSNTEFIQFFDDFDDFGEIVNQWLTDDYSGGPWRLQELPDAELRLGGYDEPMSAGVTRSSTTK